MADEDAATPPNEIKQSDREVSPEASRYVAYFEGGRDGVADVCAPEVPRLLVIDRVAEALKDIGGELPRSAVRMATVYGQFGSVNTINRFDRYTRGEGPVLTEVLRDDPYLAILSGAIIAARTGGQNVELATKLEANPVNRTESPEHIAANKALDVVSNSLRAADRPTIETTAVRLD